MSYRNGTYVAFSGNDTTNPTESDIKYFNILKLWDSMKDRDFKLTDSHAKTYQVQDTSNITTLKTRLLERMKSSKHLFLIITDISKKNTGMLNWEIEKAIDTYELPVIVAYPGYGKIINVDALKHLWPEALKERINNSNANCIHIPFREVVISAALNQFSVNDEQLDQPKCHYNNEVYESRNID